MKIFHGAVSKGAWYRSIAATERQWQLRDGPSNRLAAANLGRS